MVLNWREGAEAVGAVRLRSAAFAATTDLLAVRLFLRTGLPYRIQFAGRRLGESMLCRIAHAYEQATEWHTRHPSVQTG